MEHLKSAVENTEKNLRPVDPKIHDVFRRLGNNAVGQIVANYEAGAPITELMQEFNISKASVLKVLRQSNVTMRRQSMTAEQIEEAIVLYTQGQYSLKATAAELKLPKQSVRNALIKAGVEMRSSTR